MNKIITTAFVEELLEKVQTFVIIYCLQELYCIITSFTLLVLDLNVFIILFEVKT